MITGLDGKPLKSAPAVTKKWLEVGRIVHYVELEQGADPEVSAAIVTGGNDVDGASLMVFKPGMAGCPVMGVPESKGGYAHQHWSEPQRVGE